MLAHHTLSLHRALPSAILALGMLAALTALPGCDSADPSGPDDPAPAVTDGPLVRVSLVSRFGDAVPSGEPVELDAVVACRTDGDCVRTDAFLRSRSDLLENDMGVMAAEFRLPAGPFSSIELISADGAKGVQLAPGALVFDTPFTVEDDARTEVFVALDAPGADGVVTPRVAAVQRVPDAFGMAFLAEPGRASRGALASGVSVELAADALQRSTPVIVTMAEHDAGGVGPVVRVAPGGAAAATVRVPLDAAQLPEGLSAADFVLTVDGEPAATLDEGGVMRADVQRFGQIELVSQRPWGVTDAGRRLAETAPDGAARSAGGTCADRLRDFRSFYLQQLSGQKGYLTYQCQSAVPALHVGFVNLSRPGTANPDLEIARAKATDGKYLLQTIEQHGDRYAAFAAINGYQWKRESFFSLADRGYRDGGTGELLGMVRARDVRLLPAENLSGDERALGFTQRYTTGTRAAFFSRPAGGSYPSFQIGAYDYGYDMVPTGTLLVRDGACVQAGNADRWSAIGVGDGLLMMASSTTSGTATYGQLCDSFLAMGMQYAILLDGGGATSMYWGGNGLNPVGGLDAAVNSGPFRRVAYALIAR